MKRDSAWLILSALGWAAFVAVVVWTMAFLAGVVVPRTVDGPQRIGPVGAVLCDLAWMSLFALQHSVMARPAVKAAMRRRIPMVMERAVYVLATDVCLVLILTLWQPFGGQAWHLHGAAAGLLWGTYLAGWLLAVISTFAVDHLELTGLRQAGWASPRRPGSDRLHVGGLHGVVRHPLMAGLVIAFWATPQMSVAHLLFAALGTAYVLVGIRFEERDLRRTFGPEYDAYARRVPALLPLPVRRSGPSIPTTTGRDHSDTSRYPGT
ncbi:MAG: isoprenylcysteine carboxylmethyltransferase family protein [Tetrasphaera sp.]